MRVLFVHPSCAGPFHSLISCFGDMSNTKVLYLAERQIRSVQVRGVRYLSMAPLEPAEGRNHAERESLTVLRRGGLAASAMLKLRKEGFQPDIVCTASNTGCGFYATDIFPRAFRVSYVDWYYSKDTGLFKGNTLRSPESFAHQRVRNLYQMQAINEAHLAVTHTNWQKAQFPKLLAHKIRVLPHGVDPSVFTPPATAGFVLDDCCPHEFITFFSRSMEAQRGFSQAMRCLPPLLAARPRCHVLLMSLPGGGRSEEGAMTLDNLCDILHLDYEQRQRVHVLGARPHEEYVRIMQAASLHVYMAAPYALSSGLLEAMSCGGLVLGTDAESVREVVSHGENGFMCDMLEPDVLAGTAAELLAQLEHKEPVLDIVRSRARQTILDRYDNSKLGPIHLRTLLDAYAQSMQTAQNRQRG